MVIGAAGDRTVHVLDPVVVDCKQDIELVINQHQRTEENRVLDSTKW